MALGKRERLKIVFARLRQRLPVSSAGEARAVLDRTLVEVEDEFSGVVAKSPPPRDDDGRLYPAQDDSLRDVPGRPDLLRLRHRGHDTYIRSNGAILIRLRETGRVLFDAPGSDGRLVELENGTP